MTHCTVPAVKLHDHLCARQSKSSPAATRLSFFEKSYILVQYKPQNTWCERSLPVKIYPLFGKKKKKGGCFLEHIWEIINKDTIRTLTIWPIAWGQTPFIKFHRYSAASTDINGTISSLSVPNKGGDNVTLAGTLRKICAGWSRAPLKMVFWNKKHVSSTLVQTSNLYKDANTRPRPPRLISSRPQTRHTHSSNYIYSVSVFKSAER